MTIQRTQFIKEYRIARDNNNVDFMEWLDNLIWLADEKSLGDDINE